MVLDKSLFITHVIKTYTDPLNQCVWNMKEYNFSEYHDYRDIKDSNLLNYIETYNGKFEIQKNDVESPKNRYYIGVKCRDIKDYKILFLCYVDFKDNKFNYCYKFNNKLINEPSFRDNVVLVFYKKVQTVTLEGTGEYYWFQKRTNNQKDFLQYYDKTIKNILILNEKNYKDKMEEIYILRHNCFHSYICYIFGLKFIKDTDLNLNDYGIPFRQTPDIFEYDEKETYCMIGDVSVTQDEVIREINKQEKYNKLVSYVVENKNKKVILLYSIINSNFGNINDIFNKIPLEVVNFRDISFEQKLRNISVIYEDKIKEYPFIHKEFLEARGGEKAVFEDIIKINYPDNRHSCMDFLLEEKENFIEDCLNLDNSNLRDMVFDSSVCEIAFKDINVLNDNFNIKTKPTNYIAIPPDSIEELPTFFGKSSEQKMIENFIRFTADRLELEFFSKFFKNVLRTIDGDSQVMEKNMFFYDYYENSEKHLFLKRKYKEEKINNKAIGSFRKYCKNNLEGMSSKDDCYFARKKIIKMSNKLLDNQDRNFLDKAGANFKKNHPEGRDFKKKSTMIIESGHDDIEIFLNYLMKEDKRTVVDTEIYDFCDKDHENFNRIKLFYCNKLKDNCEDIQKYFFHTYLKHSSLAYDQMLHYANFNYPSEHYTIFNTGIPNMLCICINKGEKVKSDNSIPFIVCGLTRDLNFLNLKIFGDMNYRNIGDNIYFYHTKWARLPSHRLEFFRDQYYSVMASSLISLNRYTNPSLKDIKGIFCIRTVVSLNAQQKAMEKLMDSRFAIMSGFASYTNFRDLILEKFCPPYKNALECWICYKLLRRLPYFQSELKQSGAVLIQKPVMEDKLRNISSIGGKFNMEAFWSDRRLHSIDDLMDEIFLYVHTPKEPSVQFHQNIEAIKTIKKFEDEYCSFDEKRKKGIFDNVGEIKDFLKHDSIMGFSSNFLFNATLDYFEHRKPNIQKALNFCLNESFTEINSTKAVIGDSLRKFYGLEDITASKYKDLCKFLLLDENSKNKFLIDIFKIGKLNRKYFESRKDYNIFLKKYCENEDKIDIVKFKMRNKVHDETIRYIQLYGKYETMVEYCTAYIKQSEEVKVISDICIKAQYGSKREFYVMNMGSKIMARIVENFFKNISQQSHTEMISTPGDDKMITIQNMMDRVTKHAIENNCKIYYINGDCSKWSASEMMETFLTIICAFEKKYGKNNYFELMKFIVSRWMDKSIQIPPELFNKILPTNEKTEYLNSLKDNNFQMKSTQNFLQGVFNYMSSFKADVCNNFAVRLWQKKYPDEISKVEYLVHSDDYVVCVSCKDDESFMKFREIHKMSMKLCNITDSTKKTNVQHIFLEFVSLICFNGMLHYPIIKKTKECSTSLPCDDFKTDSDTVCSRTLECVRVGCDNYSSYIFHRIHMHQLRKLYSLNKGSRNYIENRFETPVELFGQSDMLPFFYFLCDGDPNNYRLINYSKLGISILKKIINFSEEKDLPNFKINYPSFLYNKRNKNIVALRKSLKFDSDYCIRFLEDNIAYNVVKPKDIDDYYIWLHTNYFKNSFVKAYNRDNKTLRLLRISNIISNKCCHMMNDLETNEYYLKRSNLVTKEDRDNFDDSHMFSLIEMYNNIVNNNESKIDDIEFQKMILRGDSTPVQIYTWYDNCFFNMVDGVPNRNTVASKAPNKTNWLNVRKYHNELFLYIVDEKIFLKNYPNFENIRILNYQKDDIEKNMPGAIESFKTEKNFRKKMEKMMYLYDNIMSTKPNTMVCISETRYRQDLDSFLKNNLVKYTDRRKKIELNYRNLYFDMNPFTMTKNYIISKQRTTNIMKPILNNITLLYTLYTTRMDKSLEDFKSLMIGSTYFNDNDNTYYSLLELFRNTDIDDVMTTEFRKQEIFSFCFFKKIFFNDDLPLLKLTNNTNFFSYYFENDSTVYFQYCGSNNFAKVKNDIVELQTDCKSLSAIDTIYSIALKLFGKITETKLDAILSGFMTNKDYFEYLPYENQNHYTITGYKKFENSNGSCYGFPVYYLQDLSNINKNRKKYISKNLDSNFIANGITIYKGDIKIFNLKFYNCSFCDVNIKLRDSFLTKIINSKILNDLFVYDTDEINNPFDEEDFNYILENLYIYNDSSKIENKNMSSDDLFDINFDFTIDLIDIPDDDDNLNENNEFINPFENLVGEINIELIDFNEKVPFTVSKLKMKGNIFNDIIFCLFNLNKRTLFLKPLEIYSIKTDLEKMSRTRKFSRLQKLLSSKVDSIVVRTNMISKWKKYYLKFDGSRMKYFKEKGMYRTEEIINNIHIVDKSKYLFDGLDFDVWCGSVFQKQFVVISEMKTIEYLDDFDTTIDFKWFLNKNIEEIINRELNKYVVKSIESLNIVEEFGPEDFF